MMRRLPHAYYYLLELLILLAGFALVFYLPNDFSLRALTMGAVLLVYAALGIYHHHIHHTARKRIVVEYVLISILLFAIFLFLNIN